MTYLEKATSADLIVDNSCPDEYLGDDYPSIDDRTYSTDVLGTGKRGCRGMTCAECWSYQVNEAP